VASGEGPTDLPLGQPAALEWGVFIAAIQQLGCLRNPDPEASVEADGIVENEWVRIVGNQLLHTSIPELPDDTRVVLLFIGEIALALGIRANELFSAVDMVLDARGR
jgi:hypothetical protein